MVLKQISGKYYFTNFYLKFYQVNIYALQLYKKTACIFEPNHYKSITCKLVDLPHPLPQRRPH